jgi:hypothetical protein
MLWGLILITSWLSSPIVYSKERNKFALFIANGESYEPSYGFDPLNNPINDVKGVAKTLQKAGFTSFIYHNLASKQEMEGVVDEFLKLVGDEDIVWFYYAGHGVQSEDGKSYLIPTKAKINAEEDLPNKAMSAQYVMQKFYEKGERKNKGINLFVLDTCRNSIYGKFTELKSDLVGVGGGNVMAVFSTKANEGAAEGKKGETSPFAKYLIEGVNRWHWQPLEDVLQAVGKDVRENVNGQQVYVYGWVGVPFCLSRCLGTQNITITP